MRYQAALFGSLYLGSLYVGAFSQSFAADPPATTIEPAPAAAPSSETSTPPTPAATPSASQSKVADDAAGAAQSHRLRAAGYKPRVRNGTTVWCRPETALGSRLAQVERCGTPEQIDRSVQNAKEAVENMQKNVTQRPSN